MQQILALQQQKQTMEVQTSTSPAQQTPNIPNTVIPPPNNHNPLPVESQISVPNAPPPIAPTNSIPLQPTSQTNSFPPVNNQVNPTPPPIISQEFNIPPINPNVPPPMLNQNGMEQIPFNQPPPVLPTFLAVGFPDFSKPPPGFAPTVPPKVDIEELMPSVPYFDLPAGLMIPLIKVILINFVVLLYFKFKFYKCDKMINNFFINLTVFDKKIINM